LRTTFREIFNFRQIALIDFPCTSESRRIFATISTNIQNANASDETGGTLMTPR
jgi:hypothetical protein